MPTFLGLEQPEWSRYLASFRGVCLYVQAQT